MFQVVKDTFRLLTFRITREEMLNFGWKHLVFGLICTLIVGAGRTWDNPRADILQHVGIGSLIYIFILSAILAVVVSPLHPRDWSYRRVLTFVALVSPPAILYAIPVERFTDIGAANAINALFLLVVSFWRVALLIFFLSRFARLDSSSVAVATILPITLIVIVIFALNIEKLVLGSMGGFREQTSNDASDAFLFLIFLFSILIFPICLICYLWIIRRKSTQDYLNLDK